MVTLPSAVSGSGSVFAYLVLRRQNNGTYYRVGIYVTSSGRVWIRGQTHDGSNLFADVDTGLTSWPGDTFAVRVQTQGASPTTIRAKAWKVLTGEPAGWSAVGTNSTNGLQRTGSLGVRTVNQTSTSMTLEFDDLSAS
jgi:hypothetical protein